AIPDNWDACLVLDERKAINVSDKLRHPPIPKPSIIDQIVAKKLPNSSIPKNPKKVIATIKIITKYFLSARSKITGIIKLAGIVNININESIHPDLAEVMP